MYFFFNNDKGCYLVLVGIFLLLSDKSHLQLPVNSPRKFYLAIAKELETSVAVHREQ